MELNGEAQIFNESSFKFFIFVLKDVDMITDTQRRNQILRRISKIPKEKLRELDEYVTRLEDRVSSSKDVLNYAGTWNDIDDDVFNELTANLISNRKKNRSRIDG